MIGIRVWKISRPWTRHVSSRIAAITQAASRIPQCITSLVVFVARFIARSTFVFIGHVVSGTIDAKATDAWSMASLRAMPYILIKVALGEGRFGVHGFWAIGAMRAIVAQHSRAMWWNLAHRNAKSCLLRL